jgi:hypothetical protein
VDRKTKNDSVEKGQQKITALLCSALSGQRPIGPKTKNDCDGEGQQQITALLRVVTERPLPHFCEEEAHFKTHRCFGRNKNMVITDGV